MIKASYVDVAVTDHYPTRHDDTATTIQAPTVTPPCGTRKTPHAAPRPVTAGAA
jgi:hypothetical protein